MKEIILVIFVLVCAVVLGTTTSCHMVNQGEKAFYYDSTSGKPVNPTDNPILPMGFNTSMGYNQRYFEVQGTIMDYSFTATNSDGFDESLKWNTKEGVIMSVDYKLYGRVTNPWQFYLHFGEMEYHYAIDSHKDVRVYQALRQSGKMLDQYLNELLDTVDAEYIRTHPDWLKQQTLPRLVQYMSQFGFEITDMMFLGNFQYPDGNVIKEARQQITTVDTETRQIQQTTTNMANQVKIEVDKARMAADTKIGEARRKASAVLAESTALATALKQSIDQIGIEGTMSLKMTGLLGDLTQSGTMPWVLLTDKSLFGRAFYPSATVATNGIVNSPSARR